jgi:enterochelin esterase-like enzyme
MRFALVFCLAAAAAAAPPDSSPSKGSYERIKVHGRSLEGNLEGDSPDRFVSVYLPPGYKSHPNQRYPVIYLLHGFTDSDDKWFGLVKHFVNVPEIADRAMSSGGAKEMIIVMPNAYTSLEGSFYGKSATTGDWEDFVVSELVQYIDSHYRTIANRASRGLAGHSMGGYGTVRLGMRHPDVFSSFYALSSCCLDSGTGAPLPGSAAALEAIHTAEQVRSAPFGVKAQFALAAAFSPDPQNAPLFLDLPVKDGAPQPAVLARWAANSPVAMFDQYVGNLRQLKAIAFDVGLQDGLISGSRQLDARLREYQIPHTFETYEGTHTSHVADRIETRVLPFFSAQLKFENSK